jgi:hypothetical protein
METTNTLEIGKKIRNMDSELCNTLQENIMVTKSLPLNLRLKLSIGFWENGKRHGEGIFTYLNGDSYSGWWRFGDKEGTGTYFFKQAGMKVLLFLNLN